MVPKAKETQVAPSHGAPRCQPPGPGGQPVCPTAQQGSIKCSRPVSTHLSTSSGCFCCSFFPKPNPKKHTANMGVTPMMGAAMPRYSPVMPCKESQKQKLYTTDLYTAETEKRCVRSPEASFLPLCRARRAVKRNPLLNISQKLSSYILLKKMENSFHSGRKSGRELCSTVLCLEIYSKKILRDIL